MCSVCRVHYFVLDSLWYGVLFLVFSLFCPLMNNSVSGAIRQIINNSFNHLAFAVSFYFVAFSAF